MTSSPPVADAHSDLLVELAFVEQQSDEANPLRSRWLPQLAQGGVALQVCAIYVEPHHLATDGLREALRLARTWRAGLERNPDQAFAVRGAADLRQLGPERVGLLLSLEGVDCFGRDPWLIDVFADLGVRMASLTWNDANAFAGGCATSAGLSDLGARLVDRMVELDVLVDLAHASDRTFWDVLERTPDGHALVSHAASRAVYDHPRNLSDEQLRALAAKGGVVGLMPHPLVIDPDRPTVDRLIDHVEHVVSVAGIAHVALGGDFLQQIARTLRIPDPAPNVSADATLEGLEGPADYPQLADALARRGYDQDAIAALFGGNLLRQLHAALPAA